jgi:hypothetical protein
MLPVDFAPTPYSVVCGRGRASADAVGNRRLQVIATMFIPRYAKASRKEEKSMIVTDILEIVRKACPNQRYAFIRYSSGRWWEVENLNAREKVGTVLRDSLHSKYKSSTKSKLERRRKMKDAAKRTNMSTNFNAFRPCSAFSLDPLASSDDSSVMSGEDLDMDNIFS